MSASEEAQSAAAPAPAAKGEHVVAAAQADKQKHRGIPAAHFIENVQQFCDRNGGPQAITVELNSLYGKYKFMQAELTEQKQVNQAKIPEIKAGIKAIGYLQAKADAEEQADLSFQLADGLRALATVPPSKNVLMWLGADVMMEYPLAEAVDLLSNNLQLVEAKVAELTADLAFLQDQITISEVNIARVHNYTVSLQSKAKLEQQAQQQAQGQQPLKAR